MTFGAAENIFYQFSDEDELIVLLVFRKQDEFVRKNFGEGTGEGLVYVGAVGGAGALPCPGVPGLHLLLHLWLLPRLHLLHRLSGHLGSLTSLLLKLNGGKGPDTTPLLLSTLTQCQTLFFWGHPRKVLPKVYFW